MKERILTATISTLLTIVVLSFFSFKGNNKLQTPLHGSDAPIGAIMAWSGNPAFLPDNWKVCNGLQLPKNKYEELYKIIADNWTPDTGNNKSLFKIPDLRGVFLRGVNGTRTDNWADPEKDKRLTIGSNGSNEVGSFQSQGTKIPSKSFKTDVKIHLQGRGHGMEHGVGNPNKVTQGDHINDGRIWTQTIKIYGGDKETRPNNAYVHWIIKIN